MLFVLCLSLALCEVKNKSITANAEFPLLSKPALWSTWFAAPPRLPLCGDFDGDGLADMMCYYPPDNGIIDVAPNRKSQKSGWGFQARVGFGKDCTLVETGNFLKNEKGEEVLGYLSDGSVRLAKNKKENKYESVEEIYKFYPPLKSPIIGKTFTKQNKDGCVIISSESGKGIEFRFLEGGVTQTIPVAFPTHTTQVEKGIVEGYEGESVVIKNKNGDVHIINRGNIKRITSVREDDEVLIWNGGVLVGNKWFYNNQVYLLKELDLIKKPYKIRKGDLDADGRDDLMVFRYGDEKHEAHDIFILFSIDKNDDDFDRDGLKNEDEKAYGTDIFDRDTDNDGLLDGWEVYGIRGLNLREMDCSPLRYDVICYITRFNDVDESHVLKEMEKVKDTYASLNIKNVDGTTGINFHAIYTEPANPEEISGKPWWEVGTKYLPKEHRGIAHWMQITKGGGGQANQMGDMGACGDSALWAVFMHEFGHQLGLDHSGHWGPGHCPLYPSLMNYAYSYSLNDRYENIQYSDGKFMSYVINEDSLDETLPFKYEDVSFLEKGPYRFRLKPNGNTTLIDWNWNGIFGEKDVRADINYGYSTTAGHRYTIDKAHSSPYFVENNHNVFLLYGKLDKQPEKGENPNIDPSNPGALLIRRLIGEKTWSEPLKIMDGLTGDPSGAFFEDCFWIFAPVKNGTLVYRYWGYPEKNKTPAIYGLNDSQNKKVTSFVLMNRLVVFMQNSETHEVYYTIWNKDRFIDNQLLEAKSTNPIGACVDTIKNVIVLTTGEDQGDEKPSRWQVRYYLLENETLGELAMDWIEGEEGHARGDGRLLTLFDNGKGAGKDGRIYVFGPGLKRDANNPWTGMYTAHQVADKTVRGGWLVKRYYDEWTNSRSAPAVTWYNGDVLFAYRWVDGHQGETDSNLQVAYYGLGIEKDPAGDHDDLSFIAKYGLRRSILYLASE